MSSSVHSLIEVSDLCIRAHYRGRIVYAEPGIALLPPGEEPAIGEIAQKTFRLQPTRIHSRFWADMSTNALQIRDTEVRHSADLVWHQLSALKQDLGPEPVALCVPSNLHEEQLQLLAGICNSLELKLTCMINLGLAQIAGHMGASVTEPISHLHLQLHQLVISDYGLNQGQLELHSQQVLQDQGFLRLADRIVHFIGDKFVQSSRFDPLHRGDTEQQLFDQALELAYSNITKPFEVEHAGKIHRIDCEPSEIAGIVAAFSDEVHSRLLAETRICYSPEFRLLPGFIARSGQPVLNHMDTNTGADLLAKHIEPTGETRYLTGITLQTEQQLVESTLPAPGAPDSNKPQSSNIPNAFVWSGLVYTRTTLNQAIEQGFPQNLFDFEGNVLRIGLAGASVNGVSVGAGHALQSGDQVGYATLNDVLTVKLVD